MMDVNTLPDRIGDTFKETTVFISGGTGFVGKALIDKLLRSTDVKRLYLLIRPKKGKSPHERIHDIFSNVLFETLLKEKPDAMKRCAVIYGDITQVDLGISKEDRELLTKEVQYIFHNAATTRFDETLENSVKMNTRGTKYMLHLAEECKKLKLFIHVSTAYAFPHENIVYEKEYKHSSNPHEVIDMIEGRSEDTITAISEKILKDNINSYTFSKSLAESLVYEKVGKIPVIIVRPAVVIPSFQDPIPGWFNNLQGPMGLFVAAGKGVLRSMYMDSKSYANMIPVDCTVSYLLASSWYYLNIKNAPYIYNSCVPQCDYKATWEEILDTGKKVARGRMPFNMILWYPGGNITKSKLYNKINIILFHIIPAILIDLLMIIIGQKPFLLAIHRRIMKGMEMFEFYTNKAWDFDTTNLLNIRKHLNKKEKGIYILQSDNIDIESYMTHSILAARRNILKETDDMLPRAKRTIKIMYVVDCLVKAIFFVMIGYYLYTSLSWMVLRLNLISEKIY